MSPCGSLLNRYTSEQLLDIHFVNERKVEHISLMDSLSYNIISMWSREPHYPDIYKNNQWKRVFLFFLLTLVQVVYDTIYGYAEGYYLLPSHIEGQVISGWDIVLSSIFWYLLNSSMYCLVVFFVVNNIKSRRQ